MNRGEKYIARIIFKNKIYENDGQKYEDFFVKVLKKSKPAFQAVKAHGNIGDRKNDGFDKTSGTYYQVFGPENIEKQKTISDAVNKLVEDFEGAYNNWNSICKINKFYYVVNDKYKGCPAPIHEKLLELGSQYTDIDFEILASRDLEDIFINLGEDDIIDVIDFIPSLNLDTLDYSVLKEAIEYILNSEADNSIDGLYDIPDFNDKIQFNQLNVQIERWLTTASYNLGDLNRYFKRNSKFVKKELRDKFSEFYLESKGKYDNGIDDYNNLRFIYILEKACFDNRKIVRDSVLILMACFFESCDIFENPKGV